MATPSYAPRFDSFVETSDARPAQAPPPRPIGAGAARPNGAPHRQQPGHFDEPARGPYAADPYAAQPAGESDTAYYQPTPSRDPVDAHLAPLDEREPNYGDNRRPSDHGRQQHDGYGYDDRAGQHDHGRGHRPAPGPYAASDYDVDPSHRATQFERAPARPQRALHDDPFAAPEPHGGYQPDDAVARGGDRRRTAYDAEPYAEHGDAYVRNARQQAAPYDEAAYVETDYEPGAEAAAYPGYVDQAYPQTHAQRAPGGQFAEAEYVADPRAAGDVVYDDDGYAQDAYAQGGYVESGYEDDTLPTGYLAQNGEYAPQAGDGYAADGYDADGYPIEGYEAGDEGTNESYEPSFGAHQDDGYDVDPAIAAEQQEPSRRRGGLMLVAGALVAAIAVGAALGLVYEFAVGGGSQLASGEAPVLRADRTPVKEAPADPGGRQFPDQKKIIYERLNEPDAQAGATGEQLFQRTEQAQTRPAGNGTEAAERVLELLREGGNQAGQAIEEAPRQIDGVRRVQTVQVKPDGTFSASPPPVQTRVASNNGIAMPGITIDAGVPSQRLPQQPQAARVANLPDANGAVVVPQPQQGVVAAAPRLPAPEPRTAQPTAPAAASLAPDTATGSGGYVVQIAARRNRIDALASFANLQQRYSSLLGGKQPDIQEADLGSRGRWYRLRIGPPVSRSAANDLCAQLKTSGLEGCLVKSY